MAITSPDSENTRTSPEPWSATSVLPIGVRAYRHLLPIQVRKRIYRLRNPSHFRRLRSVINPSPQGDFSLRPFDEHHCMFVHIPKTAGISVAESLFGYLPYHYTTLDYKLIFGRRAFKTYFKFAFVRNPWDRLFSAYRFLRAGGWNEQDRLWMEANISQFESFSEFVEGWLTPDTARTVIHLWPQWEFVCNRRRKIELDYVGHFESIEEDFDYVCRKLGFVTSLQHKNASAKADYRQHYSEAARRIVEEVYRDDVTLFGYRFGRMAQRSSGE